MTRDYLVSAPCFHWAGSEYNGLFPSGWRNRRLVFRRTAFDEQKAASCPNRPPMGTDSGMDPRRVSPAAVRVSAPNLDRHQSDQGLAEAQARGVVQGGDKFPVDDDLMPQVLGPGAAQFVRDGGGAGHLALGQHTGPGQN